MNILSIVRSQTIKQIKEGKNMYKYNYYLKDAYFLGVGVVECNTLDANEARKKIAEELKAEPKNIVAWLRRDHC